MLQILMAKTAPQIAGTMVPLVTVIVPTVLATAMATDGGGTVLGMAIVVMGCGTAMATMVMGTTVGGDSQLFIVGDFDL